MAAESTPPVKISKIAGRYLVFDPEGMAVLRRQHNTNGTLVGTLPQQPTQNLFLGPPIEIRPEEAQALVQKGCARVVDDAAAHRAILKSGAGRAAYIEGLRQKRALAQQVIADKLAEQRAAGAEKGGLAKGKKQKSGRKAKDASSAQDAADLLFDNDTAEAQQQQQPQGSRQTATSQEPFPISQLSVTPTCSDELVPEAVDRELEVANVPEAPLARFLNAGGYHMTPGLRFGSRYSVYPGDPLRFHAHFMANQYGWDEPVPVLEIVQGGRLATAVKKAFLVGGEDPSTKEVRTFSIEWAGM